MENSPETSSSAFDSVPVPPLHEDPDAVEAVLRQFRGAADLNDGCSCEIGARDLDEK